MNTEQRVEGVAPAARRTLHPMIVIAALAVTAVSLIAAAQFLWPRDAKSQASAQQPAAETKTAVQKVAPAARSEPKPAAAVCTDCGVVVAVRESKQAGEGTGLGAVAGAVIGGVVGNQMGGGRGKDAMTAIGAVGGGIAGHQVEKQARAHVVYHVDVKMDDGATRTFTQSSPFAVGAKVRVSGSHLALRG
jgi:outer membrane lipoprotein SlyB